MTVIAPEQLIHRKDGCIGAHVGGSYVMLDLDSSRYLQLNPMGTVIWDLLEVPQSLSSLCATLQTRFEIGSQECFSEVSTLIERLQKLDLVRLEG